MKNDFERNKPYVAFDPKKARVDMLGNYTINEIDTKTLYDGRYCAVAGFVYTFHEGRFCVLANKRGKGSPDFQGLWNCPCGFLERGENGKQGTAREVLEECGIKINPDEFSCMFVQTEPSECNHGNVTIHYTAFLTEDEMEVVENHEGGEENEVEEVRWIPICEVDNYEWAFGHRKYIHEYWKPIGKLADKVGLTI